MLYYIILYRARSLQLVPSQGALTMVAILSVVPVLMLPLTMYPTSVNSSARGPPQFGAHIQRGGQSEGLVATIYCGFCLCFRHL